VAAIFITTLTPLASLTSPNVRVRHIYKRMGLHAFVYFGTYVLLLLYLMRNHLTKTEFIAKLATQGDRYVIFVPKRYVNEEIKKLRKSPNIKVIIHDEL
jgi:hypothetical protein